MRLGPIFTWHRGRRLPAWGYGLAALLGAIVAVRAFTTVGSPAFYGGRALVLTALALGLASAAHRRRTGPGAGWRLVLLPFAATALYRAAGELWRAARGEVPAGFLTAGIPLVVWLLVAGVRGALQQLRVGAAAPRPTP